MKQRAYRRLNRVSGPRATVGRWTTYVTCAVADLVFFTLALILCGEETNIVKLWLIYKCVGATLFRVFMLFEYLEYHLTFAELRKQFSLKDHRFESQMTDPFVPRHDYVSLIFGTFEATCALGMTFAMVGTRNDRTCHSMFLVAVASTALTYLKWIVCFYKSCFGCRRSHPR